jgi:hypothetical protein
LSLHRLLELCKFAFQIPMMSILSTVSLIMDSLENGTAPQL